MNTLQKIEDLEELYNSLESIVWTESEKEEFKNPCIDLLNSLADDERQYTPRILEMID